MENELKTLETFWRSLVTEDGLATSLLSAFKVSSSDEVKAFALLSRVTFLLSLGLKNDRDESLRNEEYLLSEIINIGKNCSNITCCQKTKVALDNLLQNFKQRNYEACNMTSISHDVSLEELSGTAGTDAHEKVELLVNRQNMNNDSLVIQLDPSCQISGLEIQKTDAECASPETVISESSQYGSDTVFEKTPTKEFKRILEQCNEDFNVCSMKKIGNGNLGEDVGIFDDASQSPILWENNTFEHKTKIEANCSFRNIFSSPDKIKVGNKLENLDSELPTQNHNNLSSDSLLRSSLQSNNKILTPRLDIQKDYNRFNSSEQNKGSVKLIAADKNTTAKLSDSCVKSIGHKLNDEHYSSNMNGLASNKNGKPNSNHKLPTTNQGNLNCKLPTSPLGPSTSKCFSPEFMPLLTAGKSLPSQTSLSSHLDIQDEPLCLSGKLSTLMSTPGKLSNISSNNFIGFTGPPKQDHNLSVSEVFSSSSDINGSLSPNHVDEHAPSRPRNVKKQHTRPLKKLKYPFLPRYKSTFSTLSISKTKVTPISKTKVTPISKTKVTPISKTKVTPISKTKVTPILKAKVTPISTISKITSDFHTSNANAEISFSPSPKNDTKKMLRQTTLTQDFFLGKVKETKTANEDRKKEPVRDHNHSILLYGNIEESSDFQETEDALRMKKDQLKKIKYGEKFNSSTIKITSSEESEKDLFISSDEETKDGSFLTNLTKGPNMHRLSINSGGKQIENQINFDEVNLEHAEPSGAKGSNQEGEKLASLEVGSQVLDVQLEFNNSVRSEKLGKQHEKVKILENSFDLVLSEAEDISHTKKKFTIQKKFGKHNVDGYKSQEGKDNFQREGSSEEKKKHTLKECSSRVTSDPNAGWDLINECSGSCGTQFENFYHQRESISKKIESKNSSPVDGKNTKNINRQDISMAKDERKKGKKSKKRLNFTDAESDANEVMPEGSELRKKKKSSPKKISASLDSNISHTKKEFTIQKKFGKHNVDGYKSQEGKDNFQEGSSEEKKKHTLKKCSSRVTSDPNAGWDLINKCSGSCGTQFENFHHQRESISKKIESKNLSPVDGKNTKNINRQDISMAKDERKKGKNSKKRLNFTDAESDANEVMPEGSELRKKKKRSPKKILSASLDSNISHTKKEFTIQKKFGKHNVDGYKSQEGKDNFQMEGSTEEKKKHTLKKCSSRVTSDSNAGWDLINECSGSCGTQFENFHHQRESISKKIESKSSSPVDGKNTKNINRQDISMAKDERKKGKKSKKRLNFTDAESDANEIMPEGSELRKKKKSSSKKISASLDSKSAPIDSKSAKLVSSAPSKEYGVNTLIGERKIAKNAGYLEILTSKNVKKKHKSSDAEFDFFRVGPECKKIRKDKSDHSEESKLSEKELRFVEKEMSKKKKDKKPKRFNTPKLNLDETQSSSIIYKEKKGKEMKKVKCNYSKKDWWHVYM